MIEKGSALEGKLIKLLKKEYSKPRTGTHVSDIILCLRESVWRKIDPQPLTSRDLSFFALGSGSHLALQRLANKGDIEDEKHLEYKGIVGSVDMYQKIPIEVKTSRSKYEIKEPKPFHLTQLRFYMAMLNSNVGVLFYFLMNNFEKYFDSWTYTLTNKELKDTLIEMEEKSKRYNIALELKDPFSAPGVRYDTDLNWKCGFCNWKKSCWAKE